MIDAIVALVQQIVVGLHDEALLLCERHYDSRLAVIAEKSAQFCGQIWNFFDKTLILGFRNGLAF